MNSEAKEAETKAKVKPLSEEKKVKSVKPELIGGLPWVEEYRPKQLSEVVFSNREKNPTCAILNRLEHLIHHSSEHLPHLLVSGPPGTGKTSTIACFIRELYRDVSTDRSELVLELNASKDRGIETMRTAVKQFAARAPSAESKPRLIILDEADYLTRPAQDSLRLLMEEFMRQTRFILICNNLRHIQPALRSRCTLIRFPPLSEALVITRLEHIAKTEKQDWHLDALPLIAKECRGDLRRAVGIFQSAITAMDSSPTTNDKKTLQTKDIRFVLGQPTNKEMETFFISLNSGSFERLQRAARDYIRMGWSVLVIALEAQSSIMNSTDVSDTQKAEIAFALADLDLHIVEGADEYLELLQFMSRVSETLKNGSM